MIGLILTTSEYSYFLQENCQILTRFWSKYVHFGIISNNNNGGLNAPFCTSRIIYSIKKSGGPNILAHYRRFIIPSGVSIISCICCIAVFAVIQQTTIQMMANLTHMIRRQSLTIAAINLDYVHEYIYMPLAVVVLINEKGRGRSVRWSRLLTLYQAWDVLLAKIIDYILEMWWPIVCCM